MGFGGVALGGGLKDFGLDFLGFFFLFFIQNRLWLVSPYCVTSLQGESIYIYSISIELEFLKNNRAESSYQNLNPRLAEFQSIYHLFIRIYMQNHKYKQHGHRRPPQTSGGQSTQYK